jgi:hypothetical protein
MPVLVGGLAYPLEGSLAAGSISTDAWLRAFYAAARDGQVDLSSRRVAIAIHPYPDLAELAGPEASGRFTQTIDGVRTEIAALDPVPDREIWVTELGVSTTAPGPDGSAISPETQARALVHYLDVLERAPDVAAAIVYTLIDRLPQQPPAEEGFGVVTRGPDFQAKPAYCALAALYATEQAPLCTTG